jgi:hypothetical protein
MHLEDNFDVRLFSRAMLWSFQMALINGGVERMGILWPLRPCSRTCTDNARNVSFLCLDGLNMLSLLACLLAQIVSDSVWSVKYAPWIRVWRVTKCMQNRWDFVLLLLLLVSMHVQRTSIKYNTYIFFQSYLSWVEFNETLKLDLWPNGVSVCIKFEWSILLSSPSMFWLLRVSIIYF